MPSTMPSPSSRKKINKIVAQILKKLIRNTSVADYKRVSVLRIALNSLAACPVSFVQVSDLKELLGFESASLRLEIEQELRAWYSKNGQPLSILPSESDCSASNGERIVSGQNKASAATSQVPPVILRSRQSTLDDEGSDASGKAQATTKNKAKSYVPQHRTGTHGILVALYALTTTRPQPNDDDDTLSEVGKCSGKGTQGRTFFYSKADIIHIAQPFSDAKYIPRKAPSLASAQSVHSFNSAWSGMKTMINRGYVYRNGNPARFGLSALGWDVAKTCASREVNLSPGCKIVDLLADESSETSSKTRQVGKVSQKRQRYDEEARKLLEEGIKILRTDAERSAVARAALPKFSRYYELVYASDE